MFKSRLILVATALAWASPLGAQLTSDNFGELVDAAITAVRDQYDAVARDRFSRASFGVDVRSEASNASMADAAAAFLRAPPRNYRDVTLDQVRPCSRPNPNVGLKCELVGVDFLVMIGEIRRDGAQFRVALQLHGRAVPRSERQPVWRNNWRVILVLTEAGRWQVTEATLISQS